MLGHRFGLVRSLYRACGGFRTRKYCTNCSVFLLKLHTRYGRLLGSVRTFCYCIEKGVVLLQRLCCDRSAHSFSSSLAAASHASTSSRLCSHHDPTSHPLSSKDFEYTSKATRPSVLEKSGFSDIVQSFRESSRSDLHGTTSAPTRVRLQSGPLSFAVFCYLNY